MADANPILFDGRFKDIRHLGPFGYLVPTQVTFDRNGHRAWICECSKDLGGCGKLIVARSSQLTCGKTKSCGCRKAKASREYNTTHGMRKSSEYRTWAAMKNRCRNPNASDYCRYGGRGITVCDRWVGSFAAFLEDMGRKPDPSFTIERVDPSKGYAPGNCRWASRKEQSNNRGAFNRLIAHGGETMNITQWAERYGMKVRTLRGRLNRGMSFHDAVSTPVLKPAASITSSDVTGAFTTRSTFP